MSKSIPNGKVRQEFLARFGQVPGTEVGEADRSQWEQLCLELLTETERLRDENTRLRRERDRLFELHRQCLPPAPAEYEFATEEVKALCEQAPSLPEVIAALKRG